MAVQDWNTDANANTNIDGINIAEGCPAGGINGAIRSIMANVRVMYNGLPVTGDLIPKTGGVFTGNPIFTGRGGYLHNKNAANAGGQIHVQASGGTPPSMANGDWLAEY